MRSSPSVALVALGTLLLSSVVGSARAADPVGVQQLARRQYFEGVPADLVTDLSARDVRVLAAMLDDPAEKPHWPTVVEMLGSSGRNEAFPFLARFADRDAAGEVDASEYRARLAVPIALGHLARSDPRALDLLLTRLAAPTRPSWRHGAIGSRRMADLLDRSVISGLGIAGTDRAIEALTAATVRDVEPQSRRRHAAEALGVARKKRQLGPDASFQRPGVP